LQSLKIKKYLILSGTLIIILSIVGILFYKEGVLNDHIVKKVEEFFLVKNIETIGRKRASKPKLLSILKNYQNTTLLSLDLESIQLEVEKVPWIKKVIIRRILPNKLSLTIEEFIPKAVWVRGRDRFVLDRNGYLIEKIFDQEYKNYFTVKGVEADLNLMMLIENLENFPEIYNQIDYANFIGRRRWDLHYKTGVKILLPQDKVNDSLSILQSYIKNNRLIEKGHKKIDLRVDGKITTDRVMKND
jgi:cell division protein FtsQ